MGLISMIKGWWGRMFASDAEKAFGVKVDTDTLMDVKVAEWINTYNGHPAWVDADDNIKTIKMAKAVCLETARLATLDIDVEFDGGARAEWLKKQYDNIIAPKLRNWCEFGCAVGTIILKPTNSGIDMFLPGQFRVINDISGRITDIIFQDAYTEKSALQNKYYTKLERHSFLYASVKLKETDQYKDMVYYHVENKAFLSFSEASIGKEIPLTDTKWSDLLPDAYITKENDGKIESMLFGTFRMPAANDFEFNSPLSVSIFSDAMEELRDLDIAYSRNSEEIEDSAKIVLLDERLINLPAEKDKYGNIVRRKLPMPRYVRAVTGIEDTTNYYQEIVPTLNTDIRITGINNLLSLIGYKCGYSNGYFVLDQKTGMVTATQIEADNQRTIQLIKDIRDALQNCLNDLFYAQSVFADLYNLAPVGTYEAEYNFQDITYNHEENLVTMRNDAQSGIIPKWMYIMEKYALSELEAKKLVKEAQNENQKNDALFREE